MVGTAGNRSDGTVKGRYQNIAEIVVPVDIPMSAGLDYIYRARVVARVPRPRPSINDPTFRPAQRA